MHWRAHSDRMTDFAVYDGPGGVLAAVRDELGERVDAARAAGVPDERIVLDPGLGFAKTAGAQLDACSPGSRCCSRSGFRVLVGASRKSFLGHPARGRRRRAARRSTTARTPPPR